MRIEIASRACRAFEDYCFQLGVSRVPSVHEAHTCFDVAVACARNTKPAIVKEVDRYELNVLLSGDPSNRERKYGLAVMRTNTARCEAELLYSLNFETYRSMAVIRRNLAQSACSEYGGLVQQPLLAQRIHQQGWFHPPV